MQNQQHIVDTLFIIALLTQILKISDLVFREHQKKKIQDTIENFTLAISYINPINWFRYIFEKKVLRWVLIFIAIITIGIDFISEYDSFPLKYNYEITFAHKSVNAVVPAVFISLLLVTFLGFKLYGFKIIKWIFQNDAEPKKANITLREIAPYQ